jgi:hypothetical protein
MNFEKWVHYGFCFCGFWLAFSLAIGGKRWQFPQPLKQSLEFERKHVPRKFPQWKTQVG